MAWRVASSIAVVAIVAAYAVGSGRWVATSGEWYRSLEQPWWQPPAWVFGVIWPYNFLAITVVGIALAMSASPPRVVAVVVLLAVTVALAIAWAWLFYGPHALTAAAVALTAAAVLTIPITAIATLQQAWMGLVLAPYQVWVLLAASLSWGYAVRG